MGSFPSDTFFKFFSININMFMYRQQLRYLLLFMYSLPYLLYMFSPICMWSAALNKPGFVITQGMEAGGGGVTTMGDNKQRNSWILNDLGRNSLLGKRKKIAKLLMRTFTYRSTFLYGCDPDLQYNFYPETYPPNQLRISLKWTAFLKKKQLIDHLAN